MNAKTKPAPNPDVAILNAALRELSVTYNGFSGNCAQVALVLDEVLGTDGDYVVVAGDHYQYADHVLLRWENRLWDLNGGHSVATVEAYWSDEDSDEPATLEDFKDPGATGIVVSIADANSVLAGGFDAADFKRDLLASLVRRGFASLSEEALQAHPEPLSPAKTTPKPKF